MTALPPDIFHTRKYFPPFLNLTANFFPVFLILQMEAPEAINNQSWLSNKI